MRSEEVVDAMKLREEANKLMRDYTISLLSPCPEDSPDCMGTSTRSLSSEPVLDWAGDGYDVVEVCGFSSATTSPS